MNDIELSRKEIKLLEEIIGKKKIEKSQQKVEIKKYLEQHYILDLISVWIE